MTDTDLRAEDERGTEEPPAGPRPEDPEDPWHGIPAALLDGAHYDTDSAGGCG